MLAEPSAPQFLSVEEAASLLKVRGDTVRRWLRDGTLRGSKLNRLWRISSAEIERLASAPPDEQPDEARIVAAARRAGFKGDAARLLKELRREPERTP